MNNIKKINIALFECCMQHIYFLDFSKDFFEQLAEKSEVNVAKVMILFPGGIKQFIPELEAYCDSLAIKKLLGYLKSFPKQRIRDKVTQGIIYRLNTKNDKYRVLLAKLQNFYNRPEYYDLFLKTTWQTANQIWQALGDKSVDFNYYTKRTILSTVYKTTLCYYLRDQSKQYKDTLCFLNSAIDKVMSITKIKNGPGVLEGIKKKIPFIRLMNI